MIVHEAVRRACVGVCRKRIASRLAIPPRRFDRYSEPLAPEGQGIRIPLEEAIRTTFALRAENAPHAEALVEAFNVAVGYLFAKADTVGEINFEVMGAATEHFGRYVQGFSARIGDGDVSLADCAAMRAEILAVVRPLFAQAIAFDRRADELEKRRRGPQRAVHIPIKAATA